MMSLLDFSLQQLKQQLFRVTGNRIDKRTRQPLLSKEEMLDLQFRAQSLLHVPGSEKNVSQQNIGEARSVYYGRGLDYEESRAYQSGDEPRFINWRLSARTGELQQKVFREERRPGVFIVVDRQASMRFATQTRLKVTQAARVATLLAFSALQRHAAVGGMLLDEMPTWIKESVSEQSVFNLLNSFCSPCPPITVSSDKLSTKRLNTLQLLQSRLVAGTELYLISDFSVFNESDRDILLSLATAHEMHAIHVFDPAEKNLPKAGRLRLATMNETEHSIIETNNDKIQTRYQLAAEKYFNDKKQLFESLNITYQSLSTVSEKIESELRIF